MTSSTSSLSPDQQLAAKAPDLLAFEKFKESIPRTASITSSLSRSTLSEKVASSTTSLQENHRVSSTLLSNTAKQTKLKPALSSSRLAPNKSRLARKPPAATKESSSPVPVRRQSLSKPVQNDTIVNAVARKINLKTKNDVNGGRETGDFIPPSVPPAASAQMKKLGPTSRKIGAKILKPPSSAAGNVCLFRVVS